MTARSQAMGRMITYVPEAEDLIRRIYELDRMVGGNPTRLLHTLIRYLGPDVTLAKILSQKTRSEMVGFRGIGTGCLSLFDEAVR